MDMKLLRVPTFVIIGTRFLESHFCTVWDELLLDPFF